MSQTDQLKISLPRARGHGRRLVLLIPVGLLAALGSAFLAWTGRERSPALEERVTSLEKDVADLKAKEAERQRLKEINAAVEARLTELASKVGPGRVK